MPLVTVHASDPGLSDTLRSRPVRYQINTRLEKRVAARAEPLLPEREAQTRTPAQQSQRIRQILIVVPSVFGRQERNLCTGSGLPSALTWTYMG